MFEEMRVLVQRVRKARVWVDGKIVGEIDRGILALAGFARTDTQEQVEWMANKLVQLRIFPDESGKMNRNLLEAHGDILVVSQFTLYGELRKGTRPSYHRACSPESARNLYMLFVERLRSLLAPYHRRVETGIFGAYMQVELINDGPVTLMLEREAPENR